MSRPAAPASGDRTRYRPGAPVALEEVELVACVYGPRTIMADIERMLALGDGWARGIAQWQHSGATYLLLVARTFDGGCLAEPEVVLADDRATLERAIWQAMGASDSRLCLLESFEPALVEYVEVLIAASRRPAGHA
ncbi:MAG TPA: hypothetical protein VFI92_05415 [Steroidobacteraceae bacterium]|nr:hypothetical protein [Steroidobacteraceae bacterium]